MTKSPPRVNRNSIGLMLEFAKSPIDAVSKYCASVGDVYEFRVGFKRVFVMSTPEAAKHILQTNHRNYIKDRGYKELSLVLGKGLVTNEGDSWLRQRRLAQPAFYKESLEEIFKSMGTIVQTYVKDFEQYRGKPESVNVLHEMMGLTLEIVLRGLFGREKLPELHNIHEIVTQQQEYVITRLRRPYKIPFMGLTGQKRRFNEQHDWMDNLVRKFIAERKASGIVHQDLMGMFMSARDEETGEAMDERQLIDECITMIGAGHETSANGMAWALLLCAQAPNVWARIKAEADSVYGDGVPNFAQVMQLQYTRQVVDEVMRLYPPAWTVGRENLEEDEPDGWRIPKGSFVLVPIYIFHHNPKFWPDPERFDPDRFSPEASKNRPKFHYFPFGAGPRMCIGNQFALMEMQLILAMLAQRFTFEVDQSHPIQKQPLITLRSKYGVKLFVK